MPVSVPVLLALSICAPVLSVLRLLLSLALRALVSVPVLSVLRALLSLALRALVSVPVLSVLRVLLSVVLRALVSDPALSVSRLAVSDVLRASVLLVLLSVLPVSCRALTPLLRSLPVSLLWPALALVEIARDVSLMLSESYAVCPVRLSAFAAAVLELSPVRLLSALLVSLRLVPVLPVAVSVLVPVSSLPALPVSLLRSARLLLPVSSCDPLPDSLP